MRARYSPENHKSIIIRYLTIVITIVFVISAVLFSINLWEKNHSGFEGLGNDGFENTVHYKGKEYVLKENIETYLLLGLDKFDSVEVESYNNDKQADFLMLLVVDNENSSFTALHINRDTVTEMNILGVAGDNIGTTEQQIALAHTYGNGKEVSCRNTAAAVSKLLYNANIDHYLSVTMDAVSVFNDLVGGVEVTVLDDFTGIDDLLVKDEKVVLHGEHALNYVRTRYGLDDSTNNNRMNRQRQYLRELYSKTQQCIKNEEGFINRSFLGIVDYIVSDCSVNKLEALTEKLSDYEFNEICSIDGETVKGEKFMEFYPDEESVKEITVELFYTPKN